MGSLALVLRCLEAALQLPQVCSQELMGKRFDGCHSVLALNLSKSSRILYGSFLKNREEGKVNCQLP